MAERYSRLFALDNNLYVTNSPVIISAGALLKDNQTEKVLAQLKIKNISTKTIKALKLDIKSFDTVGNELVGIANKEYLDLDVAYGSEFGQKSLIPLQNSSARSYVVSVREVIFSDNSIWTNSEEYRNSVIPAVSLSSALQDDELVKQYNLKNGKDCQYNPQKLEGLWYCACGAVNMVEADNCAACGKSASALFSMDMDELNSEKEARLAEEKAKAEAAAAQEKKKMKIALLAVLAAAIITFAVLIITEFITPAVRYNKAVKLMESCQYQEAITAFEALDGYKDSAAQIENCNTALKDIAYNDAVALYESGQYEQAKAAFAALHGYKDSAEQIESCEKDIAYNDAVVLMDSGKYEEAITALEALDGYLDSAEQIEMCKTAIKDIAYNDALTMYKNGQYMEATVALETLDGYRDSDDKAAEIYSKYLSEKLKDADVGDTVLFGTYEQDNNTANGKEHIEWRVLAKEDNKILLISEYALDCKPYNTSNTDVTWETCSLHNWMNGTFLNAAFSAEEQAQIQNTTVSADMNPNYSTDPGNATTDKVFLLSIVEAEKYLATDSARQCKPTDYAVANGAYVNSDNGNCWWWLRSPGYDRNYAAYVYGDGSVLYYGGSVNYGNDCVRPALWINLDS